MKKTGKIIISVLIIVAVVVSFTSCNLLAPVLSKLGLYGNFGGKIEYDDSFPFPEGYTGGVQPTYQFHLTNEVKWLETYEEALDAVTRLRAHGTEIGPIALFDCEEYGYDLKFCVIFSRSKSEALSEGQNYFDRKLANVDIITCVFFEDVTIDELIFSSHYYYDSIEITAHDTRNATSTQSNDIVNIEKYSINKEYEASSYLVTYNDSPQFTFESTGYFELTYEQIGILEKTLVVI